MILLTALVFSLATELIVDQADAPPQLSAEAASLKSFLDQGFDRRQVSLQETRKAYQKLKQEIPDSPVTDYAFALVLLERNQYEQGMQILDGLRENRTPAFAPVVNLRPESSNLPNSHR